MIESMMMMKILNLYYKIIPKMDRVIIVIR